MSSGRSDVATGFQAILIYTEQVHHQWESNDVFREPTTRDKRAGSVF